MKRCVIGILAHVDAGKTTLSEAMLFSSGMIRTLGRVDHGDAFLDTFSLERKRGITIFSKQAVIDTPKMHAVLLDTPGHADFSSEAERTLDVLDCAILVLSGSEGIQSHTRTIWKLLKRKNIPTLLFINKMDLPTPPREEIIASLNAGLQDGFFDITAPELEAVSMCGEELLDEYLETGSLSTVSLVRAFARREIFPCVFGAALRLDGVDTLLDCLETYAPEAGHKSEFGARVYKISRDDKGVRLTHIKLTGGSLRVRDIINGEKVTQLRIYSGAKFTPVDAVSAGEIAVVTGLNSTHIGQGLGSEPDSPPTTLEPVLTYTVELPESCDVHKTVVQLMQLEEEDPQLHLTWNERTQQLRIRLMGQIQLEIIRQVVLDRFGLEISFGPGEILYRETIKSRVEGVGHFEPLRHYAEVHLLLEPGAPGSGITAVSSCPEDVLDRNWQRLIMTHIFERRHLGVLTGSPLTDVKITLASGKSHPKHTEGGDFRQATYRAIRQGLMQAESVLLEPWYDYRMELPQSCVGRAVTDLQRMGAEYEQPETDGENAVLTGRMPVASLGDYHREFTAYTHGAGRLFCTPGGYAPCTTQDEVVSSFGYEPESDLDHSPDSVFCEGGAGYIVKWFDVTEKMHLPSCLAPQKKEEHSAPRSAPRSLAVSDDELMAIFERTYGPIKRDKYTAMRKKPVHSDTSPSRRPVRRSQDETEYVLVDGYNIIFAWEELKQLAESDLDTARTRLIDILRNYQGYRETPVIVVFDAYKVKDSHGSVEHAGGLTVVYTKEAETADMFIEKAAYDLSRRHKVRVATSDRLEQLIILGNGALRISSEAFEEEVRGVLRDIRTFLEKTYYPDPLPQSRPIIKGESK